MFEFDIISEINPVSGNDKITESIRRVAESMDIRWRNLHSGTVHDARIMS